MLYQTPANQQDSNVVPANKVDTGIKTSPSHTVKTQGAAIQSKSAVIPKITDVTNVEDSNVVAQKSAVALFTVPYRCNLNRDSLRAENRKVVLEIDTIPKGLQLIAENTLNDSLAAKPLVIRESIFKNHLLIPKQFEPKIKVHTHHNWMVLVVMLVLILIGILRVFYQKKFSLFINAFLSRRFSNQIIREENALTQSTSLVLTSIFFIAISLFLFTVGKYFNQHLSSESEFQSYLLVLLACTAFYFLKYFLNKICGYIFKVFKEIDEYIFNQFLVIQILGLVLTLWCILLNYSSNINKELLIYLGFGTLAIGFVIRMIKSFGIVNMNSYSAVYIFLYLCTLEILPLIIIVKLIIR